MPTQEDTQQLRAIIRELGFNWLDEELENTFSTGKLQSKKLESKRDTRNAFEQVPYDNDEQFSIIIKSINNYFIELPAIQHASEIKLKENLQVREVNFYLEDSANTNEIPIRYENSEAEQIISLLRQIS
jgi:hypothetical protein